MVVAQFLAIRSSVEEKEMNIHERAVKYATVGIHECVLSQMHLVQLASLLPLLLGKGRTNVSLSRCLTFCHHYHVFNVVMN